jgi:hypothetical protein
MSLGRKIVYRFGYVNYAEFAAVAVHHCLLTRSRNLRYDAYSLVDAWNSSPEAIGKKPLTLHRLFAQYRRIKQYCADIVGDIDRQAYYQEYMAECQTLLDLPREVFDLARKYIRKYISSRKIGTSYGLVLAAIYLAAKERRVEITMFDLYRTHYAIRDVSCYTAFQRNLKELRKMIGNSTIGHK